MAGQKKDTNSGGQEQVNFTQLSRPAKRSARPAKHASAERGKTARAAKDEESHMSEAKHPTKQIMTRPEGPSWRHKTLAQLEL